MPGRFGVCLVIGSAALGALVSIAASSTPGPVLGAFLVLGTVAATLAVRPRTAYLVIPVPALAYLVAALIVGIIHDRGSDGSGAVFAVNGTQWIASGFIAMAIATGAAILITVIRWRRSRPAGDEDRPGARRPARRQSVVRQRDKTRPGDAYGWPGKLRSAILS